MNIRPITNTYHPNFKGTVDDSVKKVVFKDLKDYCEHETFIANNTERPLDTTNLKTMSEIARNAIKKLEVFMKKCHPDTKIVYNEKSCTKNHYRIINPKITDSIIRFEQDKSGSFFSQPIGVYGKRIDIDEPNMAGWGYADSIKSFSAFVEKITNNINPKDIDKALLESGKNELLELIKKPTFVKNIKAKLKAKKLEKIAKELGFNDFAQDIKNTITTYKSDKKSGVLKSQIQAKLRADNEKAMKEILHNSHIIN